MQPYSTLQLRNNTNDISASHGAILLIMPSKNGIATILKVLISF